MSPGSAQPGAVGAFRDLDIAEATLPSKYERGNVAVPPRRVVLIQLRNCDLMVPFSSGIFSLSLCHGPRRMFERLESGLPIRLLRGAQKHDLVPALPLGTV